MAFNAKPSYGATVLVNYHKCREVILSCTTLYQLTNAIRYAKLFQKKYNIPLAYSESLQLLINRRFSAIKRGKRYGTKTEKNSPIKK